MGAYFLIGRLGQGGQGVVYLGRATDGRWVAVKVLRSALAEDRRVRARFEKEIAAAKRVGPAYTASVLDVDLSHDPPYLVSTYVPGLSLSQRVKRDGPLAGTELTRLALRLATALAAVHRANVVHRDLKPSNVLLSPDGPKIIDFGVARALDATATVTGSVIGTPAYMAPEQFAARPEPEAEADPGEAQLETDCWAWAATIAYAGLGRPPFGEEVRSLAHRVLHEPPDLSDLPKPLRDVLRACFAAHPDDRPSAEQLVHHLRNGTAPAAPARSRSRLWVLVAAALAVAITVGVAVWWSGRETGSDPPAANSTGPAPPGVRLPQPGDLVSRSGGIRLLADLDGPVVLTGYGYNDPNFPPHPFYQWDPQTGDFDEVVSGVQAELISPGGRWLAVVPQLREPPTELVLSDRLDGSETPIPLPSVQVHTPLWSADGRRLLLTTGRADNGGITTGFLIIDTEHPDAPVRVRTVDGERFFWNQATGNVIANRDTTPESDLLTYRPDGHLLQELKGVGKLADNGLGPVTHDGRLLLTVCPDGRSACVRSALTGKLLHSNAFRGAPEYLVLGWYDNQHYLMSLRDSGGSWHVAQMSAASSPQGITRLLASSSDDIVFVFRQAPFPASAKDR